MLQRFESIDRFVQGEEEEHDMMESRSVDEFFKRGPAACGGSSLWKRAASKPIRAPRRNAIGGGLSVEAHLASIEADGECSPDPDALMQEIQARMLAPGGFDALAEDPLLAVDVGFVQRSSPLRRRLISLTSSISGKLPSAGRQRKSPAEEDERRKRHSPAHSNKSTLCPGKSPLQGATHTISKQQLAHSRKSPRLLAMASPPSTDDAGGKRITPGLSTQTPKSTCPKSTKSKRWKSALETLEPLCDAAPAPACAAISSADRNDALDGLVIDSLVGPAVQLPPPSSNAAVRQWGVGAAVPQWGDSPEITTRVAWPAQLEAEANSNNRTTAAAVVAAMARAAAAAAAAPTQGNSFTIASGPTSVPSQRHLGYKLEAFSSRFAKPGSRSSGRWSEPSSVQSEGSWEERLDSLAKADPRYHSSVPFSM